MATVEMTLDVQKPQECIEKVEGRRGDTATVIRVEVVDGGSPYDFSGKYLELALIRPDGEWVHVKDGCVQEGSTNIWNCTLPAQATAYDGLAKLCYFVVRNTSDEKFRDSTQRFIIDLDGSATAEAHLGPYSDQVDRLIREAESIVDAWKAQMKAQQAAYEAAEAKRDESYAAAESARDTKYAQAESKRDQTFAETQAQRQTTFEQNETQRQTTFEQNEADRGRRSNEAVEKANSAADRANKAADDVHTALEGDMSAIFDTFLDTKKDVAGGFPKWETYQDGIKNAGTPDDVTLAKDSSNRLLVKDSGITTAKIADLNVTTAKLADACITTAKLDSTLVELIETKPVGLDINAYTIDELIELVSNPDNTTEALNYLVGKERIVEMSGFGKVPFRVVGVRQDTMTNGSSDCITFQACSIVANQQMNTTNVTTGGYAKSAMKTYIDSTIYNSYPSDIKNNIVTVNKKLATTKGGTLSNVACKGFIATMFEVYGSSGTGTVNEGNHYKYWADNTSSDAHKMYPLNSGSAYYWWSASVYSDTYFCIVNSDGNANGGGASSSYGVVPCFCIGKS